MVTPVCHALAAAHFRCYNASFAEAVRQYCNQLQDDAETCVPKHHTPIAPDDAIQSCPKHPRSL